MNIVLFGIKGCGKTTFGKKIATKLKRAFIDTDSLIEDLYHLHRGQKISCRQIFEEIGPKGFRSLEYEVIQSLQDVQNSVIAVGGGALTLLENVEALEKNSCMIYLIFEKDRLRKRVLSLGDPPIFLDPNDPETSFDRMYEQRDELYRKFRANELDITEMKDQDVISSICTIFDKKTKGKSRHGQ
jgi:shikimate kinase